MSRNKKKARRLKKKMESILKAVDLKALNGPPPRTIEDVGADITTQRVVLRQARLRLNYESQQMDNLFEEIQGMRGTPSV